MPLWNDPERSLVLQIAIARVTKRVHRNAGDAINLFNLPFLAPDGMGMLGGI